MTLHEGSLVLYNDRLWVVEYHSSPTTVAVTGARNDEDGVKHIPIAELTIPPKRSREDIEHLKANWLNDPCWDIEMTEGFEAHYYELKEYHYQVNREAKKREEAFALSLAHSYGLNEGHIGLVRHIQRLERRLDRLEKRLDHVESLDIINP